MKRGGERRAMENWGGMTQRLSGKEWVMCSTCSSFVCRKKRTAIPKPDEEVVTEAEKMRYLMKAVLLHGPLQEMEPAEATEEQRKDLRRRRKIMMETKKCPTCSSSLLEACSTCFPLLPDLSSTEEGSEFMAVDGAMVVDARWERKLKRLREDAKRSSSRLKEKKTAKSEDKEGSGLKKKAKRSSGSKKKAKRSSETEGNGLEEAKIEFIKSVGGDRKSKMVTKMLDKKSIDFIKNQPPLKPPLRNSYFTYQHMVDIITPYVEVDRVLLEYLQYHYSINGYAEVQLEVTDDEVPARGSDTQRSEASKSRVSALVYEFLPNGSLEDRLNCVDSTLPLTWLVRIRIIREVCSALIFLHKHNPHPGNILLDANFMSKVSDFGISRVLMESSVNGSNAHFASYAERCSEWPLVQAEQLARIGLQCSALSRQKRPDLQRDVWRVMEPMINEDPAPLSQSFRSMFSESGRAVAMPPFVQSLRFHEILRWQRMASPTKLMILDGWMVGMTHLQQQTKLLQTVTPSRITPCVQPCIKENLHQSKMQELFALG